MSAGLEDEVCSFVKNFLNTSKYVTPSNSLLGDLGMDGNDAIDFMNSFSDKFGVDITGFCFSDYFGPEHPPGIETVKIILRRFLRVAPEEAAGLRCLRVSDLVLAAKTKRFQSK